MLNAELKILGGKYQGKIIPLTTKRFLVGREADCQLRPNSELVSRHHCVFVTDDYAVRLRDLGSTNGTRVNGDLVRGEIVLKPGDRVMIGRLEMELLVGATAKKEVSVPLPASTTDTTPTVSGLSSTGTIEMPALNLPDEAPTVITPPEIIPTAAVPPLDETSLENVPTPPPSQTPTMINFAGDTAILPGGSGAPMAPLHNYPQMAPMGYPMGFPYQMPSFPQPMPGYGYGMPSAYPMAMPQMPTQFPSQQLPPAVPAAAPPENKTSEMPVRLPDPTSTGAKEPQAAPAPAPGGQAPAGQTTEKPSESAADIIKSYMTRRVGH